MERESPTAKGSQPDDTESMFRLLFERTADPVWLFDPRTTAIIDCNEAVAALMRSSRADLVGRRADELSASVQPDGSPTEESVPRRIAEILKSGNSRFEWTARRFDGTEVPLEVNATAIERNGQPVFVLVSRDITERKEAEAALLQSEARFRLLFERSADAMSLFDPQSGRFIESNQAVVRQTGAPSREALGNASPAEISPECQPDGRLSSEKVKEMVKLALTQGSYRFEWLSRRYDGSELPLDIVMTAVPFGERTLLFVVSRDISEHKRAESEIRQLNASLERRVAERTDLLRESEEKFRVLFEGTSQAVVLHDENGIFEANPSWLRLLGYYTLEAVVGKHPAEVSAPIQPGGERAETLAREYIAKALADGSARFEWIVLRRDGTEVPIEVLLTPIQLGGRQLIQAVCDDITERKRTEEELRQSEARLRESEARFSTAFRASPLNITILRLSDAKFIEANDAFVNWLGLGRDRIIGHDSRELGIWLNPNDGDRFLTTLRRDGSLREVECELRSRRGTVHTLLQSADVIEINCEPHILVFGLDITQRKQAEAELHRTLAREKELGQLRSNFVSMVSHEFRTPLAIIQSSAEILSGYLERLEPTQRKEQLQSIAANGRDDRGDPCAQSSRRWENELQSCAD